MKNKLHTDIKNLIIELVEEYEDNFQDHHYIGMHEYLEMTTQNYINATEIIECLELINQKDVFLLAMTSLRSADFLDQHRQLKKAIEGLEDTYFCIELHEETIPELNQLLENQEADFFDCLNSTWEIELLPKALNNAFISHIVDKDPKVNTEAFNSFNNYLLKETAYNSETPIRTIYKYLKQQEN